MERATGIEPASSAWKAEVLPLNYTRRTVDRLQRSIVTQTGTLPIYGKIPARAWQTLFITSVSMFLVAMDVTIISVALPGITESFSGTPPTTLSWVFTAYNITFAALLLLGGKLGDRWGRKRSFMSGLVLFAVASLIAAIAPDGGGVDRGTRAPGGRQRADLSGLARPAPAGVPAGTPLDGHRRVGRRRRARWRGRPDDRRAPGAGRRLAGRVLHQPAVRHRRADRRRRSCCASRSSTATSRSTPSRCRSPRWRSGCSCSASSREQSWGWDDPKTIAAFVGAAVLLPIFVIRSARHPHPLLDLDLFRIRSFTVASFAQVLFTGSTFGWLVLMPTFFISVWGWSPLAAGFGLAPAAAISALLSPLAGRLADRIGHRWLVAIGCTCGAAGTLWWIAMVSESADYPRDILPGMVLNGLGTTAGFATLTGALMSRVPARWYSMAGAARSTLFQLGTAIGIAVAVAVVDAGDRTTVGPYEVVWWIATICAIVAGALMVALFPRRSVRDETAQAAAVPVAASH